MNWAGMSSDTRASYDYGHTEYGCDSGISIAVIAVTLLGIGALTRSVARCRNILPGFYSVLWTIHLPCDIAQSMQLNSLLKPVTYSAQGGGLDPNLGRQEPKQGVNSQLRRLRKYLTGKMRQI